MISAVVCTYNPRTDYLERCLEAIVPQVRDRADRELFIVDNASVPPVAELDCVRRYGLRVVREERQGLTAARERAACTARDGLLVFVDDDNVLAADYLDTAVRLFADPRIGMLSGCVEPEYETPPAGWIGRFEEQLAIRRLAADALHLTAHPVFDRYFPIGAGCCARHDLLLRYFDSFRDHERIEGRLGATLSAGEDIDMALYAISSGYLVGSCGRLRVTHLIPPRRVTPSYLIALHRGSLASAARINAKWRSRLGGEVFPMFDQHLWVLLFRAAVYSLLALFPSYRIRFHSQLDLLRLRAEARGAAPAVLASPGVVA